MASAGNLFLIGNPQREGMEGMEEEVTKGPDLNPTRVTSRRPRVVANLDPGEMLEDWDEYVEKLASELNPGDDYKTVLDMATKKLYKDLREDPELMALMFGRFGFDEKWRSNALTIKGMQPTPQERYELYMDMTEQLKVLEEGSLQKMSCKTWLDSALVSWVRGYMTVMESIEREAKQSSILINMSCNGK